MTDSDMITFDLGTYRRPITTSSPEAKAWCNQGLLWAYGFAHEESERCFERAAELDPDCVFAHWGIAYSVGPNYNVEWDAFSEEELPGVTAAAYEASQRALACAHGSEVERDLAHALAARFPVPEATDDLGARNVRYADAMAEVYHRHTDDLDVAALYADALINLTPWRLWDRWTGEPAEGSRALEARAVLERGLTLPGGSEHPGVLHVYIHLMEMSAEPQTALPAADRLRTLVPDAGHLVHMATHLDVLCGDYRRTVEWNQQAAEVDQKYVQHAGPLNFAAVHDVLAVADAMLDGEVAYRRGEHGTAFAHLRRAVQLDDELPYDEPWGWMQPTRHALGALLLEQGRIDEAKAVYRADLGLDASVPRVRHHPNNVWSLHGYHECLTQLGKDELAAAIGQQLSLAKAYADVPVESSCFCRLDPHHCH